MDNLKPLGPRVLEATPNAPVEVEGLMQLARNWCLTWGEWAHDADPGGAKENAAETALRAALTTALAQQPAACPKCDGTGEADSGGIHPWGAPATIPCDCQQPAAVDGAMPVLTELVATLAATGTVTGGRIYFPERQTRELLKKACDALAAQQQQGGAK